MDIEAARIAVVEPGQDAAGTRLVLRRRRGGDEHDQQGEPCQNATSLQDRHRSRSLWSCLAETAAQSRVRDISNRVSKQVQTEHREADGQSREEYHPGRGF